MTQNVQVSIFKAERNCLNIVGLLLEDYKADLNKKRDICKILEHFKVIDGINFTKNKQNKRYKFLEQFWAIEY